MDAFDYKDVIQLKFHVVATAYAIFSFQICC